MDERTRKAPRRHPPLFHLQLITYLFLVAFDVIPPASFMYSLKDCEFKYFSFLSHTNNKKILQEILNNGANVHLNHEMLKFQHLEREMLECSTFDALNIGTLDI